MRLLLVVCPVFLILFNRVAPQGFGLSNVERRDNRTSSRCKSTETCVDIRKCPKYRNQSTWRQVLGYCRTGRRSVCCPHHGSGGHLSPEVENYPKTVERILGKRERREVLPEPPKTAGTRGTAGRYPDKPEPTRGDHTCGISLFKSDRLSSPEVFSITGRHNAQPGMFPWMVAILKKRRNSEEQECTGFLIDYNHVLSAAHCFRPPNVSMYSLRIGNIDWHKGRTYKIAKIDIPQGYVDSIFHNDLAVLTTVRPIQEPNVLPICLPSGDMARMNLTNLRTTLAGWSYRFKSGNNSDVLRYANHIPVLSNADCSQRYRTSKIFEPQFNHGISNDLLCADLLEGGVKDNCEGNSGSPLMTRRDGVWFAVGISVFGKCGLPWYPEGFARITEFLDFIKTHTM